MTNPEPDVDGVSCPVCHAAAGEPCHSIVTGEATSRPHPTRRAAARPNRPDPTMTPRPNRPTTEA